MRVLAQLGRQSPRTPLDGEHLDRRGAPAQLNRSQIDEDKAFDIVAFDNRGLAGIKQAQQVA